MVGAIAKLTQAIATDGNCTEAYLLRGQILYSIGNKDAAKADMQKVLELDPERLSAVNGEYTTKRASCH